MTPENRPAVDEKFTYKLHRHLINLMCFDSGELALSKNNNKPFIYNFSAFVVEIDKKWLVVTAGHIFSDIKKAIEAGSIISDWQIDDSSVTDTPSRPYPISLDIDNVLFMHDTVPGMDYAAFELSSLAVLALKKEGIVAITEELWEGEDFFNYPHWILVGTPHFPDLLQNPKGSIKYIASILLRQRDSAPPGIPEKKFKCLYADLDWDSVDAKVKPSTVDGMSGGPIFALDVLSNSEYRYKVIGIQSSRNNSDSIAFCAAPPFLEALKQTLANKKSINPNLA